MENNGKTKTPEEKLQQLRRISIFLVEAADPVFTENLDGIAIDMNNEAVRTYGWKREEFISPLRPANYRLRDERKHYRTLFGANENAVCVIDSLSREIMYFNRAAEETWGVDAPGRHMKT